MAEADEKKGKELALLVYVLQAVGFVIGLTWILAVIISYVKRDDVRGLILLGVTVWGIYRVVKGWLALSDGKPLGTGLI